MTRSIAGRSIPPPAEFCRRARIAYRTPRKLQSSRSTGCYNPAGPMVRRRVGLTVMLALLIIGVLLSVLPWHAGAIRLAGVSVPCWYAAALAPGVAVLVRLIVGTPAPVRALASWVAPALFVSVAMQIFVAAPAAPLVALAAILAPMMAGCVRARAAGSLPRFLALGILSAAVTLVACANFLVVADPAPGVGLERWHGLLLAAPLALVLAWRDGSRWRQPVLVGSVGLLAIAVVAVAVATGVTPWRARGPGAPPARRAVAARR